MVYLAEVINLNALNSCSEYMAGMCLNHPQKPVPEPQIGETPENSHTAGLAHRLSFLYSLKIDLLDLLFLFTQMCTQIPVQMHCAESLQHQN